MASKANKKRGAEPGKLVNGYLILYNLVQAIGWSYLLLIIAKHYQSPEVGSTSLWGSVKYIVLIFQNAAVLEILHAALGMVSSSVVLTTFQVLSRVMVVCGVLLPTPTGPASPGLPLALVAWSVTEIIRYLYYACNLLGMQPYLLVWCRYSLFMVLYPVGVTGELLCLYAAQAHVSRTKMWSVEMPNRLNFTFSYHYLLLFVMFLYIPLFPQLYLHMFAQRRKILGSSSKKAQ
ncbi:very-long-chain (3R)-3-hydroxyacyl-CoA dehydratase 2 [Bacillus rossius redtenbacheri]|uniref:very-long-chain (3R)-3-hydroxyacyl-CoA dehydratase 2 n=1 Tax=Bacillus rossius redtenbacheri TaxID=93214 RepID=UPI002FDE7303